MTIEEVVKSVEAGLTVWPDGKRAIGPSNEEYVSFMIGRALGGEESDGDLVERMKYALIEYKKGGRYISWRRRLQFYEDEIYADEILDDAEGAARSQSVKKDQNEAPAMLTPPNDAERWRCRYLRCRVLITALPPDQEWLRDMEEPNEFAALMRGIAA